MKTCLMRLILLIVAVTSLGAGGCAAVCESRPVVIKSGNERLVATDVFVHTRQLWCQGGDKLVYSKRDEGLYYYEPKTGESTLAADDYNVPVACSPDGEWLVYYDKNSYRYHENDANNSPIADVWRYEFKTGERQKILVKRQEDYAIFDKKAFSSAGRNKLCIDAEEIEGVEMPEPRWEIGWENRDCAEWVFSDGSAIAGVHQEGGVLVIDVLSAKNEPSKIYSKFARFDIKFVDKKDRLFLYVYKDEYGGGVQRCEVDRKNGELSCMNVLEDMDRYSEDYGIFSDGETVVFFKVNEPGDNCVKAVRPGGVVEGAPCVTAPIIGYEDYLYSIMLSPDDKYLVVGIGGEIGGDGKETFFDLYIHDLNLEK